MLRSRPPSTIPALLPAVLIADREHAASVGDLNLSEGLFTNQRAHWPKTLPPLRAETQSPSPGCYITGPAFLEESSHCWSSQSASQHRAVAGKNSLQVAPLHTTHTDLRALLSDNCFITQQIYITHLYTYFFWMTTTTECLSIHQEFW